MPLPVVPLAVPKADVNPEVPDGVAVDDDDDAAADILSLSASLSIRFIKGLS